MSRRLGSIGGLAGGVAALLLAGAAAAAEDLPFVDGESWKASAAPVKRAYLIGIGNYLNAEYAFQKTYGPPKDNQTTVQRMYEGIDDLTLDESVERIDRWYKANPDKQSWTVLEVIWVDMVEPNLPASRKYE